MLVGNSDRRLTLEGWPVGEQLVEQPASHGVGIGRVLSGAPGGIEGGGLRCAYGPAAGPCSMLTNIRRANLKIAGNGDFTSSAI